MARVSKADKLAAIHTEALTEFNRTQAALQDERKQCITDRRFASIPGAQWEGQYEDAFANRPRMEINKIAMALNRVVGEYRNNRVMVDFVPKDGAAADETADTCDGLFRADYADSNGDEACDNAFEEAASGGFGAFRLRTQYEDEYDDENEKQRIRFEMIADADTSVYFDLDAKRMDKSDASHCWVLYSVTRNGYVAKWGDDPTTWPKNNDTVEFDWATPDVVYVAEYYRVEDERTAMVRYEMPDGKTMDFEAEDVAEAEDGEEGREYDEIRMALLLGGKVVKEWVKRSRKVHKYIMSGGRVLEDAGYIAGKNIPIVPVYGKRWFIDNVERCMGVVRLAKDPQRLKNMQISRLAETAALSAVQKPILLPEQVAGHQLMWAEDNVKNYPYLLVNPITDANGQVQPAGPLSYTQPPAVPPAMAALLQLTEQDMAEVLGYNPAQDKMVSNISGKAVEMIQNRIDQSAFIYLSNFAKAMRRAGEIWLGMAQDVYVDDDRAMKSMNEDGSVGQVKLMQPIIDEDTGEQRFKNDLSRAKLDVAVDVGPAFTSRRDATVRAITGLLQMAADPQDQKVLLATAMMNMDGEGLSDLRQFYRRQLVGMGAVEPNDEERAQMEAAAAEQGQQQDPNAMLANAMAMEAQAKAQKAVADTALAEANTEKARAQTVETLAKVEGQQLDTAVKAAQAIGGALAAGGPPQGL